MGQVMNLPTFLVLLVVIAVIALAIRSMYKDKKAGKSCSCGGCMGFSRCHGSCHTGKKH